MENPTAKKTFMDLLKSMIKVNEDRFRAIKKTSDLESVNVARPGLFLRTEELVSSENYGPDPLAVIIALKRDNSSPEELDSSSHEDEDEEENDSSMEEYDDDSSEGFDVERYDQKPEALRIWKSCTKKSAKVCKKACVKASKSSCSIFVCSRKLRKRFKKDCKEFCKVHFRGRR